MDTLQQLILDMLQAKMPAKNPESLRHFIGEIKARDDHVLQAGAVLVNRDVGPDAKLSSTLVLELIAHADPFNVISAVLMLKIHCRNVTDQCLECFAYTTLKVLRNLLNDFSLVRALLLEGEICSGLVVKLCVTFFLVSAVSQSKFSPMQSQTTIVASTSLLLQQVF